MPRSPRKFVNPFDLPGKWYKGNFHCHTRTSDGAFWPQEVTRRYRAHGYDVLALTDHENTNDIRGLSDKKMLVINGSELHPPFRSRPGNYHLVALDLPHGFAISRESQQDIQACLNQVHGIGGVNILAHPKEMSMTMDEIVGFKHLDAVEVWTTLSEVDCDAGSSEAEWAGAMEQGMFMTGTGSDDTHWAPRHGLRDAYGGWTMLKMRSLSVKNVLEAIRTAACYASAGPTIHDFRVEDGQVKLTCSPVIGVAFKGTNDSWIKRHAKAGRAIRGATADLPDEKWPFVRAVVVDDKGRKAWTNPIRV